MKAGMTPIIPIKQIVISFAGHDFLAVQLLGGGIAVVFRHFCEALNLDLRGQVKRIQANPTLSKNFLLVRITTPGGPQVVYALAISVLSLWLGGFQLTRLSEEKRRLIIQLQEDAEAAFSRPFTTSETMKPPKSEPLPPQEQGEPSLSGHDLLRLALNRLEQEDQQQEARLVERIEEGQQQSGARFARIERRLQKLQEEVLALRPAQNDHPPAAGAVLSEEQEEVLHMLLYCAKLITGEPQEQLQRELLAVAGVAEVSQIRQADWFAMTV
jgi:hypothetical protein